MKTVKIKYTGKSEIPKRQTLGSAGYDVHANLIFEKKVYEELKIAPFQLVFIPTGIHLEIPIGYECQIRARSSLCKKNLMFANGIGTIDSDYRGEIFIPLRNLSNRISVIKHGERIVQLVFNRVELPVLQEVSELSDTERGQSGFGSTGE